MFARRAPLFLHDCPEVLVAPDRGEARMAQPASPALYPRNSMRATRTGIEPRPRGHLWGREAFAPAAFAAARQVSERASDYLKLLQMR